MEETKKIIIQEISQKQKEKIQKQEKKEQEKKEQEKKEQEKKEIKEKEKKKRVVTEHKLWAFTEEELSNENQWSELNKPEDQLNRWLTSQIRNKIYGYLGQDIEKREREKNKIVDPENAIQINLSNILKKLITYSDK
jgi:hypothetical protein